MSREEDPEVVADLKLRSYTERDGSRGGADYNWTKPKIVGAWKCRNTACQERVGVTQDAFDRVEIFNRELKRQGEKPLDTKTIVFCDGCAALQREAAADRRRQRVDAVADVIKQLKEGVRQIRIAAKDGHRIVDEREALLQLEKWGHPDVKGFEQALAERRQQGKGRREKL